MGNNNTSDISCRYQGDNYHPTGSGYYESGYRQGYRDGMNRSTSNDPADYLTSANREGSKGYADGVKDSGWNGMPGTYGIYDVLNNAFGGSGY
jgi:hypothetical protein